MDNEHKPALYELFVEQHDQNATIDKKKLINSFK